jgi:gamma-glutamyltranspeptidase/glutathione hydrolase/leukotriene-C4 hydrolase
MLGMFNLMEHYNLHPPADLEFKSSVNGTRTGLNMHRITEAMKFAFGARTEISDPDSAFMDEKRRERVTGFAQREWAERIGKELTDVSALGREQGEMDGLLSDCPAEHDAYRRVLPSRLRLDHRFGYHPHVDRRSMGRCRLADLYVRVSVIL